MPKKKETTEGPAKDLTADHPAAIRLPRGHWDTFMVYCLRENLTHKEAITRMIERCVDLKYFQFIYGSDWDPARAKAQTRAH